jgi:hypothetical protein
LNITMTPAPTQGSRTVALAMIALLCAACGGGTASVAAPASPEAAVRGFLNAVHANSLTAMGELWGSSRGPARSYMDRDEMNQRLTVIRTYLVHERFELLETQSGLPPQPDGRRQLQVRLTRRGCTPVVPFTVVPHGGGWLVSDIDLSAAGNPARPCAPQGGSGGEPRAGLPAFTQ